MLYLPLGQRAVYPAVGLVLDSHICPGLILGTTSAQDRAGTRRPTPCPCRVLPEVPWTAKTGHPQHPGPTTHHTIQIPRRPSESRHDLHDTYSQKPHPQWDSHAQLQPKRPESLPYPRPTQPYPISLKGLQHTSVIELLAFMRLDQHSKRGSQHLNLFRIFRAIIPE